MDSFICCFSHWIDQSGFVFDWICDCSFYIFLAGTRFLFETQQSDLKMVQFITLRKFCCNYTDFPHRWNILLCYIVFVIFANFMFGFFGCYILDTSELLFCNFHETLRLSCFSFKFSSGTIKGNNFSCKIEEDKKSLYLDCFTLCMVILHRKLLKSRYFCYVVIDTRASTLLASRWVSKYVFDSEMV